MLQAKATFIKRMAATHNFDSIPLCQTDEDSFKKFSLAWNGTGSSSLFITSRKIEPFFSELKSMGWRIVYVGKHDFGFLSNRVV